MENRTILFVDDESGILNSLGRLIRSEPYHSLFAGSGKEALNILEREIVHVIVTDIGMPDMDGFTLLRLVNKKRPDIIPVVLSANAKIDAVLKAINEGNIYRYIIKPWNDAELKGIIRQAVNLFDLEEAKRALLNRLEEHNLLLEEMVEKRTKQLLAIQSQAEIGKHASQIVHNLNNPLQTILGGVGIIRLSLSKGYSDGNRLEKYLNILDSGVSDMEKIVSGILMHAKSNPLNCTEQIDLNEIVEREMDFFQLNPTYRYKIEKQINLSDDLPPITGNPIHFKQIIDNLVKNAVDAMDHSPEKLLTILTSREGDSVRIRISDTGEGIEEKDLAKIFSPDFSTKPVGRGTGLGLASVKTMVEAYAGNIKVQSIRGKGTTFTVAIPVGASVS